MPRLLTTAEAAARLGIDDSQVRRLIRDGRLPAERFGARAYAIREEAVAALPKRKRGRPFRP